jgi:Ca2+-binding RTX toxin-like protein
VSNTETITGGTGADTVSLGTVVSNVSIDLGSGSDNLIFGNFANTATVANTESIVGGTGNDAVTLGTALTVAMSVDLGGGSNSLTLKNVANTGTVQNVTTLSGGTANDTITYGGAVANASIDLGTGSDVLTFGNATNSATVANTETIIGGTGNDTIALGGALTTAMSVDLGTGLNKLSLDNATNAGSVSNVQSLKGGSGQDSVTLGTAVANGSVDLGAGSDTLQLGNGTNHACVTNTETVFGGTGDDTITLTGSNASLVDAHAGMNFITGNSGADQYVFDQSSTGNNSTILNFSSANGDMIALDTTGSATLSGNTYDLGGAALGAADLTSAADATIRLGVTLSNGGKGGFVYQQDTGELYYSSNGNFTGGGTLVGVIDSASNTAWAYDASKFTQV